MSKFQGSFRLLAIAMFTIAFASFAQAQATRTWVSGVGDDLNPCSRTAPCKTFAGAISKTFINGEIDVLDNGSFGTVTITKSITIDGTSNLAGILSAVTNAVTINIAAGNANDPLRQVTLRGLTINGTGAVGSVGTPTGLDGINIVSNGAAVVNIEDCYLANFTQNAVNVNLTSAVNVNINNTQIRSSVGAGVSAETTAGIARVTMRNSSIMSCGTGINARRNSRVSVTGSTLSLNAVGLFVEGNGGTAVAVVERSQISNNIGNGVQAGGGGATNTSVARLSENIINNNALSGVSIQVNGSVETFLNNKIVGNNPDGCVGCTSLSGNLN